MYRKIKIIIYNQCSLKKMTRMQTIICLKFKKKDRFNYFEISHKVFQTLIVLSQLPDISNHETLNSCRSKIINFIVPR